MGYSKAEGRTNNYLIILNIFIFLSVVVARAGGVLVNGGRADWIAVASSQSEDFVSELYNAGALLVIDGTIAAACL